MASRKTALPLIGTAGWSIPAKTASAFTAEGSHLQRYASLMRCAEINTSFYRPHRPQTYEKWAASTPADFRFAVKCPKQISHECRLEGVDALLARFVEEAGGLGPKWAVLLIQLPPSLPFDAPVARRFFKRAHAMFGGTIVCEPRHESWFTPAAQTLLLKNEVARAAVDPAKWPGAAEPGGWLGLRYFRWHGSPRVYWSTYDEDWLRARARGLPSNADCWCIFDNTASGAALQNALQFQGLV
ncbi:MAG: DUF72 domain-containing protein [Roseateles sp.]|uniref:DUF72 domain-containing protein n=1 Tax=Roseateles sp. TaxID=1971397 RepID=UPI0040355878